MVILMIYEKIKKLNEAKFYRHTGVHTKEFNKYLEYLKEFKKKKAHLGGAPNKLLMEDMLIMTLKYWKEYPTFSQMSITYNISESSCFRNVNWVENALLENPDFKLPKKNYPKTEKGFLSNLLMSQK